jgi:hypothetical protein
LRGQSWPELLDPEQNRPSAYIDAAISQDAGNALGRGTHLLIAADAQQNDVTPEAMASHQARRLAGCVAIAGIDGAHRRSLPEPLTHADVAGPVAAPRVAPAPVSPARSRLKRYFNE